MTTSGGPTFATTMGVVDRVHCDTTNLRTFAKPAVTTGFTNLLVLVLKIANLTNGRLAAIDELTKLARGDEGARSDPPSP